MSLSSLFLFAGVYFAAVATPGPGVAALVGRVIGHGLKGVAPFIAGYVVGDLVWLAVVTTGLSVVAHEFATLFLAIKYAGAAYLLFVAWSILRAPATLTPSAIAPESSGWLAFLGSVSLTLGNPKVIVFFLSIMPLVVSVDAIDLKIFLVLAVICTVILSSVLTGYALAAERMRFWLRSTRAVKIAQRAAAGVMAGVAVAIWARA